jgi:N-acyl-L-homoserine lactone synthetase
MPNNKELNYFNHPMTPSVETSIFKDVKDARFWIGKTALLGEVVDPDIYYAGLLLRAKVYVEDMKFLTRSALDSYGYETDNDDDRSVHFAVAEQSIDGSEARITGTSRMILKRDDNDYLPIEKSFPEIFNKNPAPNGCLEVSRFIARHEERYLQHVVNLSLIRAMTHYSLNRDTPKVYFVIEQELWDLLDYIGLPMTQLSDLKLIEGYGDTFNMAVEIDPRRIIDAVRTDKTGKLLLTQFFRNEEPNEGLGYYRSSLTGGGDV